jgi:hypothetical protein
MRYYIVYFEFLGKKMKMKVEAKSDDEARQELYKRLTIHKVEKAKDEFNDVMDMMDGFLDGLKKKQ